MAAKPQPIHAAAFYGDLETIRRAALEDRAGKQERGLSYGLPEHEIPHTEMK